MTSRPLTPQEQLLDVVHRLTEGHVVTTVLDDGSKHFESHDGLIPQLRAAVVADIGVAGAGTGSAPSVPFDDDAWQKYTAIEAAVIQLRPDMVPSGWPERDLQSWQAWFLADLTTTDHAITEAVRMLRRWEWTILDKFDPPRRPQLFDVVCPICGFDWWIDTRDPENIQRRVALSIAYRPGDMRRSTADCSYCSAVGDPRGHWDGLQAIHELAWDIEHGVQYGPDDQRGNTTETI